MNLDVKTKYLKKYALEQSSGRMKPEEKMLETRKWRYTKDICAQINFDGVKIQELMHKINAA